ncbi:hypothetical protein MKW98_017025 [Papaver atlanticum]|uniref:Uncharacterized protein n=1 Tax=Papaver atlanticum TaxID=357466 RepID=A0AAD4TLV3_9MAGN|nr:hypothetical protein MKW98_017025 [Papaver atlanticum]
MVVVLILCLLLLGDGEVSAREVLNYECTVEGRCVDDQDCTILCRSKKYSGGICDPNERDKEPLGLCCCLN